MPVQSAHCFASHIGHTGKTSLCFQMSSYYAKKHPDLSVLVIDFAEEGDVTKRFLGGADAARGKIETLCGGIFKLLDEAKKEGSVLTSWLWADNLDVTKHAIKLSDHNANLPPNLYLISSGAYPRGDQPLKVEDRKKMCKKIKESLENSGQTWKLFCDTDGDRRPSPYTLIAYGLCSGAIVPLHLNKSDLDRTETMLGLMHYYREQGEINTQVLFVVWNFVKSLKDEPMEHNGAQLPFTPAKVSLDILDACNKRLFEVSQELPGLFVHGDAPEPDFMKSSTAVLRNLADNVMKPAEELGMPFIHMIEELQNSGKKQMTFKSGSVSYDAKEAQIKGVDDAISDIANKFEAMSIDAGPVRGGYPAS